MEFFLIWKKGFIFILQKDKKIFKIELCDIFDKLKMFYFFLVLKPICLIKSSLGERNNQKKKLREKNGLKKIKKICDFFSKFLFFKYFESFIKVIFKSFPEGHEILKKKVDIEIFSKNWENFDFFPKKKFLRHFLKNWFFL